MDLPQSFLTLLIFSPLAAAVILLFVPDDERRVIKRLAFVLSLVPLVMSLVLWFSYDRSTPGFQFAQQARWFESIGSTYHVAVDGISLPMVLLTTILTPLAILASWDIKDRLKWFMMLFLGLESAMLGLFLSLDLIIFFIFWEIGLVPMYFLIRIWGGADRVYASFKFMIYTMAGSLGLLLSIQIMGLATGTFDIVKLMDVWVNMPAGTLPVVGLSVATVKGLAFVAFFIAFAIKVPMFPFHTWLPDAHTQAPTAGSMILAGVLLKLGAYGFIRLVIPLFPEQAGNAAWALALLGMLSIVLGGFAAFGQWDFKRLVAYSSINHMGFVVLGLAVMAFTYGKIYDAGGAGAINAQTGYVGDAIIATSGAVMQMFNHGLSAAGMFFMVGVIYDRAHTRDLKRFGGIWSILPAFGAILIFVSMASLGLPGLNGFVGEFMIVRGSWGPFSFYVILSMLGLLMTGAYILKGIGQTLHGPVKAEWAGLTDMTFREHAVIWPLMALMLSVGLWPQWVLVFINDTVSVLFGQ
ncbi:MAG: NADH-quinone oxidoreductase subunit M [Anaerolineales bacterium]|nr:NADH-quinone oxidoreductase subunit M [Anaerolineales bacterium]MCB0006180.1 NADH-quinone oxidoreductase subunit M [Anaerolineales bacterium]MCB0016540.1 NADH-quinone oxidoreductase subunit M [Anaerolineales bacterium]MCB8959267.1 NADH-quinone oxidoreductase subunit M [Ardenticatenales bacterium]